MLEQQCVKPREHCEPRPIHERLLQHCADSMLQIKMPMMCKPSWQCAHLRPCDVDWVHDRTCSVKPAKATIASRPFLISFV